MLVLPPFLFVSEWLLCIFGNIPPSLLLTEDYLSGFPPALAQISSFLLSSASVVLLQLSSYLGLSASVQLLKLIEVGAHSLSRIYWAPVMCQVLCHVLQHSIPAVLKLSECNRLCKMPVPVALSWDVWGAFLLAHPPCSACSLICW